MNGPIDSGLFSISNAGGAIALDFSMALHKAVFFSYINQTGLPGISLSSP